MKLASNWIDLTDKDFESEFRHQIAWLLNKCAEKVEKGDVDLSTLNGLRFTIEAHPDDPGQYYRQIVMETVHADHLEGM